MVLNLFPVVDFLAGDVVLVFLFLIIFHLKLLILLLFAFGLLLLNFFLLKLFSLNQQIFMLV